MLRTSLAAPPLIDVALLFTRLGLTAFGGPAAHIALIEEECVRRRRWMTREQFLDVLGASNLIPGPTSTELAMHAGLHRAGWAGLVVAGLCFILPSAVLVLGLAIAYERFGALPAFAGVLRAVKPVVIVVVLQALVGLARTAFRSVPVVFLSVAAALALLAGNTEIRVLLLAGIVSAALGRGQQASAAGGALGLVLAALASPVRLAAAAAVAASVAAPTLFAYFFKVGAALFGSGYVLFAVLRGDLVERYGWLTEGQLLDAIAVGQVTPGPVFTSATFLGYVLGGVPGAAAATVGIFLPAFIFTALSATVLHRTRNSPLARAFLDGVNAAAIALIALVVVDLGRESLIDLPSAALALAAAVLTGWFRVNSAWVIAGAAAAGLFLR